MEKSCSLHRSILLASERIQGSPVHIRIPRRFGFAPVNNARLSIGTPQNVVQTEIIVGPSLIVKFVHGRAQELNVVSSEFPNRVHLGELHGMPKGHFEFVGFPSLIALENLVNMNSVDLLAVGHLGNETVFAVDEHGLLRIHVAENRKQLRAGLLTVGILGEPGRIDLDAFRRGCFKNHARKTDAEDLHCA